MIIDIHCHIRTPITEPRPLRRTLEIASRFGIQWLATSMGTTFRPTPTRDEIRRDNDHVLALMREYPDRVVGYCYLNPHHGEFCLKELARCVEAGMRGIKLWVASLADDPEVFPIVERAIELDVPLLQHAWKKTTGNMKHESEPRHVAELARRYPQARIIMAHAGGMWEYGIKAVRRYPNVTVDLSGGNPTDGLLETALRELGPQRIAFGSDADCRSFGSQLAKVDAARLLPSVRQAILRDNARRLLRIE